MWRRARAAAASALARNAEGFERLGYAVTEPARDDDVRLQATDAVPVRLALAQRGRVFGGHYALEVSTANPVLPATAGLAGRARGLVRLSGVTFAAAPGDEPGARLARHLDANEPLQRALADVDFERVAVAPDGRAVITQVGGSVVWALFPPFVRYVPLVDAQARATVAALTAFAALGARERRYAGWA